MTSPGRGWLWNGVARLTFGPPRRCFVSDTTRAILPAFGAYAGGLNVLDRAYAGLLPGRDFHAWMMGRDAVVPVSAARLEGD